VSEAALAPMFSGNKQDAKCPIAGCNKKWKMATTSYDGEYDKKIQRFLKKKAREEEMANENAEALDDSIDAGYTQV
jgi:hypothetical protein